MSRSPRIAQAKLDPPVPGEIPLPEDAVVSTGMGRAEEIRKLVHGFLAVGMDPMDAFGPFLRELGPVAVVKLVVDLIPEAISRQQLLYKAIGLVPRSDHARYGRAYLEETGLSPVGIALCANEPREAKRLIEAFGVDTWMKSCVEKPETMELSLRGTILQEVDMQKVVPMALPCPLAIHAYSSGTYDLPWVIQVRGYVNTHARDGRYLFSGLKRVDGNLMAQRSKTLSAPLLTDVIGDVRVDACPSIDLSSLERVEGLVAYGIEDVTFPALRFATGIYISDSKGVRFPKLESVRYVINAFNSVGAVFDALKTVEIMELRNASGCQFPELTEVSDEIMFGEAGDFPKLRKVGGLPYCADSR